MTDCYYPTGSQSFSEGWGSVSSEPTMAHEDPGHDQEDLHAACQVRATKTGSLTASVITRWDLDKMADISQTTFWNAFSWIKIYELR